VYTSMLFLHWKQVRHALVLLVMASFGLPLLTVGGLGTPPGMESTSLEAYRFLDGFQDWLPFFPSLAIGIGMTLALSAWNWDHRLDHVYALSVPMTRWEYTLQKLLAGLTLALVPAAGMWLGALLAAASVTLPEGLNAYPTELAVRFFFAILLSYAMLFALAAGTVRTTLTVFGVVFCFVFFGSIVNDLLAPRIEFFTRVNVVETAFDWFMSAPGPFEVFNGSWSLIDV
jgi:hypothetical protein